MGAIDSMIRSLKENRAQLKKDSLFKDKSKTKYRNTQLSFKEGTPEEIKAFYNKIKRQKAIRILKSIIIFLVSLSIVVGLAGLIF